VQADAPAAPAAVAEAPWLWDLTRYQWTVLLAAWLGWGFDVFDGLLFNFVAPVCLPSLLGVPRGDPRVGAAAGAITATLLVGWATGGIAFGWVADRIGRARTLLLTMCTYAVATAACALAPDVWSLGVLRFIAALGIGGEWAAGASLVAEVVPAHRRVAAGALLYTSSPLAVFLAAGVNDVVVARTAALGGSPELAWRLVFLAGLVPAAVAVWVRRRVREPVVWEAERDRGPRLAELFTPALRRATLGGFALCLVTLVTWWGTNAFLPFVAAFLAGPGADAAAIGRTTTYATAMFNLGGIAGAIATIPLARRRLFALYFAAAVVAIAATFGLPWTPAARIRLFFFDGLTVFGVNAAYCYYLPELFPTRLRATGAGFCFNTGRYVAALGPFLVGRALGVVATPMDAIRWVALVPLVGVAIVPFVVETADRGAGALPS
jgi:predicted MFS family arabinose efflux permease